MHLVGLALGEGDFEGADVERRHDVMQEHVAPGIDRGSE